jgi:hypothetical protein
VGVSADEGPQRAASTGQVPNGREIVVVVHDGSVNPAVERELCIVPKNRLPVFVHGGRIRVFMLV